MKKHIVTQKYSLGQEVKFNDKPYRVNAFKFEVRPMGILQIYEISNETDGRSQTTEAILDRENH